MRFKEVFTILENEAPANVAGSGAVEGIGVGDKGEPGFPARKTRRKTTTTRGVIGGEAIGFGK